MHTHTHMHAHGWTSHPHPLPSGIRVAASHPPRLALTRPRQSPARPPQGSRPPPPLSDSWRGVSTRPASTTDDRCPTLAIDRSQPRAINRLRHTPLHRRLPPLASNALLPALSAT